MRTYEETVENILKKKEIYDEKQKKRGRILSVCTLIAVCAVVFTAVPLSIFIIAKNAGRPPEPPSSSTGADNATDMTNVQTSQITGTVTEPPFIEETETDGVDPGGVIKPTVDFYHALRLNYNEPDYDHGLFILSGSSENGDLAIAAPISDNIKRSATVDLNSKYKITNVTVKAETDGEIELISAPVAVFPDKESGVNRSSFDYEFSYKYKEGGTSGHIYLTFTYDLIREYGGNSRTKQIVSEYTGIAVKIKNYDFFTFGNSAAERKLYIDAAEYFGDTKTVSFRSNGGEYEEEIPLFCLDPYDADYYGSPTAKELRMLFEARPSDMTIKEAGIPDAKTVYVGGTVGAPEGSYLAETPGLLEGKQVIAYDENNNIAGITLTNEKGGFFLALGICESDNAYVTVKVVIEEGHDFQNDQSGHIYTIWSASVRGGTSVDFGYCNRATAAIPAFVRYDSEKAYVSGVPTLGHMGSGDIYTDITGRTDDGTIYTAFNIFSTLPSHTIGTKTRAEVIVRGDVKLLSDAEYEQETTGQWPEKDYDFSFILPDGGSGTVLIYNYVKNDDGTEKPGGTVKMIHLISAGGMLHRYTADIHTLAGVDSVDQSVKWNIEKSKDTASADFAAQIVMMYAEAYRLKNSLEALDEYHTERLAELENRLSSYGIAAPEIPSV